VCVGGGGGGVARARGERVRGRGFSNPAFDSLSAAGSERPNATRADRRAGRHRHRHPPTSPAPARPSPAHHQSVNPIAAIQKLRSSRHFLASSPIFSSGRTSWLSAAWPLRRVRKTESTRGMPDAKREKWTSFMPPTAGRVGEVREGGGGGGDAAGDAAS